MNREKRKHRLQLKPHLDKLEMRRLMSVEGAKSRFAHGAVREQQALGAQLAGGDLDGFAMTLVQHPRMAENVGLGVLSQSLRKRAAFTALYGWEASLVSVLTAHPRYAAAHHLMAALTAPPDPPANPVASPPSPPVATTSQPASRAGNEGVASTSPSQAAVTTASPDGAGGITSASTVSANAVGPSPVIQDPLSVAMGGTLDVTLPNLGLGTTGVTYTITPQPLPANMTFNRQTGELIFVPTPGQAGVTQLLGRRFQRIAVGHDRAARHRHRPGPFHDRGLRPGRR